MSLRWALTAFMVGIGILHFVRADLFVQIVPPGLPWPHGLVWLSGVFEISLGLALIPERTRRLAGWGLVALYLAVFPANIYMAVANVEIRGLPPSLSQPTPLARWGRLPFQLVLIAWALWVSGTQRGDRTPRRAAEHSPKKRASTGART
ncbi:MAG TPA: hypothetical protein VK550_11260 [Polyangiaceae bacterium]|nr:hypothetical protein [Polyangiaceae bacterium]